MASDEVMRALMTLRNVLLQDHAADDALFSALDVVDVAALAPRTIPEAEARMLAAEEESDAAYRFLRDWTDWGKELVPHPRELTSWDSTRLRERIAGVVVAARDWRPYVVPLHPQEVIGLPDAARFALARAVDALKED